MMALCAAIGRTHSGLGVDSMVPENKRLVPRTKLAPSANELIHSGLVFGLFQTGVELPPISMSPLAGRNDDETTKSHLSTRQHFSSKHRKSHADRRHENSENSDFQGAKKKSLMYN